MLRGQDSNLRLKVMSLANYRYSTPLSSLFHTFNDYAIIGTLAKECLLEGLRRRVAEREQFFSRKICAPGKRYYLASALLNILKLLKDRLVQTNNSFCFTMTNHKFTSFMCHCISNLMSFPSRIQTMHCIWINRF